MATLESVDKLRERANVSYDDAKAALEACGDDILEAMIWLEKQGKIPPPKNGGYYSSKGDKKAEDEYYYRGGYQSGGYRGSAAADAFGRFLRVCGRLIHKANTNMLDVRYNDRLIITLPLSVLILLSVFAFWFVIPLLIIGLFIGCRYSFRGADVEKTRINTAMDTAANTADSIKEEISSNFTDKS
jgi:hypothetical protein